MGLKGKVHSISELRALWTPEGNIYHQAFRMFSGEYLRKYCLARTFNSRVENFMIHLKYRDRLLVGLEYPQEFTVLKTNWFETQIKGKLIFSIQYFCLYLLFYFLNLNFLYGSTKTLASVKTNFTAFFLINIFSNFKITATLSTFSPFVFEKWTWTQIYRILILENIEIIQKWVTQSYQNIFYFVWG